VSVPVTAAAGTTEGTASWGTTYGGSQSDWVSLAPGASLTLTEHVAPTIISANTASSIVGLAFSDTIYTNGYPAPAITETGALPTGLTFVDNGNGTATLSGTPATGTGALYPITITATSSSGRPPRRSRSPTRSTHDHEPGDGNVRQRWSGVEYLHSDDDRLPAPDHRPWDGDAPSAGNDLQGQRQRTATISGPTTAATGATYPVTITATNSSGSTATLALTISIVAPAPPVITSSATADFTVGHVGSFAVTTTGAPTSVITETGSLDGLTFVDGGNGTALLSGTPTTQGTFPITVTAANGVSPNATQTLSIVAGQGPAITSAASATFSVGISSSFTVTTSAARRRRSAGPGHCLRASA